MGEPASPVDLELVQSTNDLKFADRDLSTVAGSLLVTQRLQVALQLFKGEWFLDADAGIPWYQEILEKGVPVTVVDSILRKQILATEGVNRILTYSSSIDAETRIISVAFTVDTVYGPIDVERTLI